MTSKRVGYARISTAEQSFNLQRDSLKRAGCEVIFTDTASGSTTERPGLTKCLDHLEKGDTLVVWRLDRLGRSTRHLIETVDALRARGVHFASLTEGMDTSTPGGQMIFTVVAAMAQFERDLIRERTLAGLRAARERGRLGGRPRSFTDSHVKVVRAMRESGMTLGAIAEEMRVSKSTVCRALRP